VQREAIGWPVIRRGCGPGVCGGFCQSIPERADVDTVVTGEAGCYVFIFAKESEKNVFGTDVLVSHELRFFRAIGQNSLALVRERQVNGGRDFFCLVRDYFEAIALNEERSGLGVA
jgi:hypothetical protein